MGTFSKHSHRNLCFKGTKSFNETLDVSKAKAKENIYSYFGPFECAKF